MKNKEKVYKVVTSIPRGKVLTYVAVAKLSSVNNPRLVGNILHKNPNPQEIPCYRVVNAKGEVAKNFAFGGAKGQIKKLESDGVRVINDRVDLETYLLRSLWF